jgi:hypothetical protein
MTSGAVDAMVSARSGPFYMDVEMEVERLRPVASWKGDGRSRLAVIGIRTDGQLNVSNLR